MNDFDEDCLNWRNQRLVGRFAHYCPEWDYLPIDETCLEWPCTCESSLRATRDPANQSKDAA